MSALLVLGIWVGPQSRSHVIMLKKLLHLCPPRRSYAPRRSSNALYRYQLQNQLAFGKVLKTSKPAVKSPQNSSKQADDRVLVNGPAARVAASAPLAATAISAPAATAVSAPAGCVAPAAPVIAPPAAAVSVPAGRVAPAAPPAATAVSATAVSAPVGRVAPAPAAAAIPVASAVSDAKSASSPRVLGALPDFQYPMTPETVELEDSLARLPSVTRILQATMDAESRAVLQRWEQRMVEKLGREGFNQLKRSTFATGHRLHAMISEHLLGGDPEESSGDVNATELEGLWRSVRPLLAHVGGECSVELAVRHDGLGYCGVADGVAEYRQSRVLLEWKTSRRPRPALTDTYDNPLQAAAYLGAYNYSHRDHQLDQAVLVIAYSSAAPSTVHVLDHHKCRHYWRLWLQRLEMYKKQVSAAAVP